MNSIEYKTVENLETHYIADTIFKNSQEGWILVQILPNVYTEKSYNQIWDNNINRNIDIIKEVIKTDYTVVFKREPLARELYEN